jgi:hypothetical protein
MSLLETLQPVCAPLLMPSESEYPVVPVVREERTWAAVRQSFGAAPVEEIALEELLAKIAFPQEWHDDLQRQNVPLFQALMTTLQSNLTDIRVYRVGAIEIHVHVLGVAADGAIAGVQTVVIET